MYLLDTNHCSRLLQGHPTIKQKLSELGENIVATCVIVRGELIFMGEKSKQKSSNLDRINQFLSNIKVYPVDDQTADIYGKLKATILNKFGPKDRNKRNKIKMASLGFS